MSVEEPTTDQTHLMRLAEERVYAYTRTKTPLEVRDQGVALYEQVGSILSPFEFKHKPSFLALWGHLLCGLETDVKGHLEALSAVALNNELKRLVTRDIRTPSKHKGILKRVLNLGTETFGSLFAEVDLTSVEQAQRDHSKEQEARRVEALEALLASKPLDGEFDGDALVMAYYDHVRNLSDPVQRNTYMNRILVQVVRAVTTTPTVPLLNLLVQFYDRLVHHEIVSTVAPAVTAYLERNPIDFFRHSLQHMPLLLEPHSNFKGSAAVLDPWQRATLKAIKAGSNILLNLPTSAGKTVVSSGVLNDYADAWFVVPTLPLAEQLTGILLATLMDKEARKGADLQRNVRLESEGSSYRRFQKARDNIVVATPLRLWSLIHGKALPDKPKYIVLDEGHNLGCPILGPAYEYILKYAAFHGISVMILTATMRDSDYEGMIEWLKRLLGEKANTLFTVAQKRRFFNQQRRVFRVHPGTQKVTSELVDPLEHLTSELLRSPTFRHPGLVPGEVLNLYSRLSTSTSVRLPTAARIPTLDDVEVLEESLFKELAASGSFEAFRSTTTTTTTAATTGATTASASAATLTPYQVYMTLKAMKPEQKPLLLFKLESLPCMKLFLTLVRLAQDMSKLVYANFADDQPIIDQYLKEASAFEEASDGGSGSEVAEEHADKVRAQRDILFASKYSPRLARFYKEYLEAPIDPADIAAFNAKYGANLTAAFIAKKRAKHAASQLAKTASTIQLRTDYAIHHDMKISTYSSSTIMKDIRHQINDELDHQRALRGPFPDMRLLDPDFDEFNNLEETIHWKKWDPVRREWRRTRESETRKQGRPWSSGLASSPDGPDKDYTYSISYDHPVLVGIECGLLFYNELLNPALTRTCQLLLSKHPLIVVSDKGLATGINYPIRTVWLQGAFPGEPVEVLDNTLAQQAMGRAGRRGHDREATIYMSGVDMKNILMPQYRAVKPNDPAHMIPLVEGEDEAFRRFVLTEERACATTATVATPVTKPASVLVKTTTTTTTATTVTTEQTNSVMAGIPTEEDMKNTSWEDWA